MRIIRCIKSSTQFLCTCACVSLVLLQVRTWHEPVHVRYESGITLVRDKGAFNVTLQPFRDSLGDISINGSHRKETVREATAIALSTGRREKFLHESDATLSGSQVTVIGRQREQANFLCIGIPSIRRVNGHAYLLNTLQSLVNVTSSRDRESATVIVFLADFNITHNALVIHDIQERFQEFLNSGFIQVVQVSRDYYPNLIKLKKTFKDTDERIEWRSKQVVDYSFLFRYAQNQSQYYLQLEDDVICAEDFIQSIRAQLVLMRSRQWAILEFSELGFIGKLVKSRDLHKLSEFMRLFYDEQPVDWLIHHWRHAMAQDHTILVKPTLFQHVGRNSSFATSHENRLQDRYFGKPVIKIATNDVLAKVYSSMEYYGRFSPQHCYGSYGQEFFWATNPHIGDYVGVVFERPQYVSEIIIVTGHPDHEMDILYNATVHVSHMMTSAPNRVDNTLHCTEPFLVGHVRNASTLIEHVQDTYREAVKCIIVTLTAQHDNWIVFNQIGIRTYDKSD